MKLSTTRLTVILMGIFLLSSVAVQASIKEMKLYKEAYPESKPKCIDCHTDAMPKKDDGMHEPNDYGLAVKEAAGSDEITAETFKTVGKIEEFKK